MKIKKINIENVILSIWWVVSIIGAGASVLKGSYQEALLFSILWVTLYILLEVKTKKEENRR